MIQIVIEDAMRTIKQAEVTARGWVAIVEPDCTCLVPILQV